MAHAVMSQAGSSAAGPTVMEADGPGTAEALWPADLRPRALGVDQELLCNVDQPV